MGQVGGEEGGEEVGGTKFGARGDGGERLCSEGRRQIQTERAQDG